MRAGALTIIETVTNPQILELDYVGIMLTKKTDIVEALQDRKKKNINPLRGE